MDRLRWDNIARAAAVLAVVALVVAWPHLKGSPPTLPSAAATPVSVEDPALPAAPPTAPKPSKPKPHAKPRHRPRPRRVRRRKGRPARPAPAPPPLAPPAPAPVSAAPRGPSAGDMAAHEFAVP